jgi:uncharacterized membrane protein YdjX (TVP38/TMEM64 family)
MIFSLRALLRGIALIAILAAAGLLLKEFGIAGMLDEAWIDTHVRQNGIEGELIYIAAAAVLAAGGFPRQILSFMAGYAFGLSEGFIYALIASAIGCLLAFLVARYIARALVAERLPARFKRVDSFLSDNTFVATLLIRFLPFGNNLATNLAAGLSQARGTHFVGASILGYIPQTLIFALLGSGITLDPELRISLSVVLFAAASIFGVYLFRKYRRDRAVAALAPDLESPSD